MKLGEIRLNMLINDTFLVIANTTATLQTPHCLENLDHLDRVVSLIATSTHLEIRPFIVHGASEAGVEHSLARVMVSSEMLNGAS